MKFAVIALLALSSLSTAVLAEEGHSDLAQVCKAECPSAKSEDEAKKCVEDLLKSKKQDRKFRKSDCHAAYKEHSQHEGKEHNH